MMKNNNMKIENDELGSIGIGAMIVFIALILVAAVASAVIIQTGEKLQQNAQQTGSDTQQEISGKISVSSVFVDISADTYLVLFESSSICHMLVESTFVIFLNILLLNECFTQLKQLSPLFLPLGH